MVPTPAEVMTTRVIIHMIRQGRLAVAKCAYAKFPIADDKLYLIIPHVIPTADVTALEWLRKTSKCDKIRIGWVKIALSNPDLAVFKWCVDASEFPSEYDDTIHYLLERAMLMQRSDIVMLLLTCWGPVSITSDDAYDLLLMTADEGLLDVTTYLVDSIPLVRENILDFNVFVKSLCLGDNVELLTWALERFQITPADINPRYTTNVLEYSSNFKIHKILTSQLCIPGCGDEQVVEYLTTQCGIELDGNELYDISI